MKLNMEQLSFEDKQQAEIRKYILRKISANDKDLILKVADNFGIEVNLVKKYLEELLKHEIIAQDVERVSGYRLVERIFHENVKLSECSMQEDRLYELYIEKHLKCCNDAASRIWQYTCAEMLNNVIEHSKGENLYVSIYTNCLSTRIVIVDDGEGVFRTLLTYMEKNGWDKPSLEDALVELYKGKITSKAENHSGEGIFFSSKMMDTFMIWSDATVYVSGNEKNPQTIQSHLLAYASGIEKIGTFVYMCLENETKRKIDEVFNLYTDIDEGFVKTSIPIKEACGNGEPVARSQARRICNRLDTFKEVILDFSDVEFMGQGFSDELFRVYALAHPQILFRPINMLPSVSRMIRHVVRGNMPANIVGMN